MLYIIACWASIILMYVTYIFITLLLSRTKYMTYVYELYKMQGTYIKTLPISPKRSKKFILPFVYPDFV